MRREIEERRLQNKRNLNRKIKEEETAEREVKVELGNRKEAKERNLSVGEWKKKEKKGEKRREEKEKTLN